ncbi:hypothetical protein AB4Y36_01495 [Paraburkholderia sp. BR10936]|uniref:hypothetical protein n=1 Tax=Paraburkholderia sp. BR10936 TaxID=3236993 RepID=UPI0034D33619
MADVLQQPQQPVQQPVQQQQPAAQPPLISQPAQPASIAGMLSPAQIAARQQQQDQVESQHAQAQATEENAALGALQSAENQPLPQRRDVPLPTRPTQSPVDTKELNQFATGLMAIAMLSTIRGNQDRWVTTLNSLNGAMSGFLQGNQAKAKQATDAYDRQFKEAMTVQQQADREYQDALTNRSQSINQMSRNVQMIAQKWGHVAMQDAAQRRSVDGMLRTAEQMQMANERLQLQHEAMSERMTIAMMVHGMSRNGQPSTGTPDDRANLVALARAGQPRTQVVGGYGRQATELWRQVESDAIDQIMKEKPGMSRQDAAREFAFEQVNLKGATGSVQQLQKMQGATVQAVSQLEFNIQKTKEALQDIPSSDISPVVNAIARGEEKWTGDPRYNRLFYYMTATAQESARILQGGQASVAQLHEGARAEAKQWADVNMTPQSFVEGVAPAMLEEGRKRVDTYREAIDYMRKGGGTAGPADGSAPLPGQGPAPAVAKAPLPPATNAKGWKLMKDAHGNMAYVSPDRKQLEEVK